MEEKPKKDHNIQDKKISVKASTCHYIAAICFVPIGLMFIFLEKIRQWVCCMHRLAAFL